MTELDRRLPTHVRVAEAYARMTETGLWDLIGDVAEIRDALQEQGEHDPAIEAVWAAIELGDPWLVVATSEAVDIDWNPAEHPRDHKGRFAKKPGGKLVSATITKAGAVSTGGSPVEINKHGVNIAAIKPGDTIVDKKGNPHTVEKAQGTKYFKTVDGSPAWVGGQTIQKHYPAHMAEPEESVPAPKPKPTSSLNQYGVDTSKIKPGDTISTLSNPQVKVKNLTDENGVPASNGTLADIGGGKYVNLNQVTLHEPKKAPASTYKPGDQVQVYGDQGTVTSVSDLGTTIQTPTGKVYTLPESVVKSQVTPAAPTAPVQHDYVPGEFVDLPDGQLGKVFKVQGDQAQIQYLNGDLKWHDTNQLVPYGLPASEKAAFKAAQTTAPTAPSSVNKHGIDLAQIKPGDTILDSKGNPHKVASVQGKKNLVFKTEDGSPAWVSANGVKGHDPAAPPPDMVEVPGLPGVHVPDSTLDEPKNGDNGDLGDGFFVGQKIKSGVNTYTVTGKQDDHLLLQNDNTGAVIPTPVDFVQSTMDIGNASVLGTDTTINQHGINIADLQVGDLVSVNYGSDVKVGKVKQAPFPGEAIKVTPPNSNQNDFWDPNDIVGHVPMGEHKDGDAKPAPEVEEVPDGSLTMTNPDTGANGEILPAAGDKWAVYPGESSKPIAMYVDKNDAIDKLANHLGTTSPSSVAPSGNTNEHGVNLDIILPGDDVMLSNGETGEVVSISSNKKFMKIIGDRDGEEFGVHTAGVASHYPAGLVKPKPKPAKPAKTGAGYTPSKPTEPTEPTVDIGDVTTGDWVTVSDHLGNLKQYQVKDVQALMGTIGVTDPATGGVFDVEIFDVKGTSKVKLPLSALTTPSGATVPMDLSKIKPGDQVETSFSSKKKFKVLEIDQDGNYVVDNQGFPFPIEPMNITKHYLPNGDVADAKLKTVKAGGGAAFTPVDVTGYTQITGPKGSNAGGLYEAPDGSKHYVKFQQTERHARNEVLANELYRAAGIRVPEMRLAKLENGKIGTVSRWEEGIQTGSGVHDEQFKIEAAKGFGMDAFLGNWDVAGAAHDNLGKVGDQPIRIDPGGALLFRAQGSQKGSAFGDVVREYDTLTDPSKNPQAAALFSGLTREQKAASVRRVQMLTPRQIDKLVDAAGFDADTATKLKETLKARRKDLVKRAQQDAPHVTPKGHVTVDEIKPGIHQVEDDGGHVVGTIKKSPVGKYTFRENHVTSKEYDSFDDALRGLLQKTKGKDDLPVFQPEFSTTHAFKPVDPNALVQSEALHSVTPAKQFLSLSTPEGNAVWKYTGAAYSSINNFLRFDVTKDMDPDAHQDTMKTIEDLDSAFSKAPPIAQTMLVSRGVHSSGGIFGPVGSTLGRTFFDNGYGSTSATNPFSGDVDLKIEIPAGTRGVIRPNGTIGKYGDGEGEVLINRGGQFEVIQDEIIDGKRTIRLRLIGTALDVQEGRL